MWDMNDLALYAAVVANGGISAAARALHAPKSRVSRRICALEAELGIRLIERSTRRFRVTEAGQDVYRHARAAVSEAESILETAVRLKSEPQGLVRISCPAGVDRVLAGALPEFLARHSLVRLQFMVTNRRVDLIEDRVDIAVQIGERVEADASLQAKTVGRANLILVASPRFLATHGRPRDPGELTGLPTLAYADGGGRTRWVLSNGKAAQETLHEPRLSATDVSLLREAAVAGMGVALLPAFICREPLHSGELQRVLPDWESAQGAIHIVFTSRRGLLPGVRAAIDFLASALRTGSPAWAPAADSLAA